MAVAAAGPAHREPGAIGNHPRRESGVDALEIGLSVVGDHEVVDRTLVAFDLVDPRKGSIYRQEFSAGVAEDMAKVKQVGADVTTGLGDFSDCIVTREATRLSPGDVEYKWFCPDVGNVLAELHGNRGAAEAVEVSLP